MTTIFQVEQRLASIGGAEFQRLCDAYLRQSGIGQYLSIGLTVGKAKTRTGTPDSIAPGPAGYTFVETTTQADGLAAKLQSDVQKCLDLAETGVPVDRIRRIFLFFTGHLSASEIGSLYALVQPHQIDLTLIGPHSLADALRYRFSSLAREHLGLDVDSGQVLDPDSFVRLQNGTLVQANLDTEFVGRDKELGEIAQLLSSSEKRPVLLVGPAGVGKTRLVLEAARRATVGSEGLVVLVLRSRGVDASTDLRAAIEHPGRYLLVVDDAHRFANLSGLLDIAFEPRADHNVRVVLTVRDYLVDSVERAMSGQGRAAKVSIAPLEDEALRTILVESFNVRNERYQRRILEIASGNARLAVMAARTAIDTNDLSRLHDATDIYVALFRSVERDLPFVATADAVRALGVLALFGQLSMAGGGIDDSVTGLSGLTKDAFRVVVEHLADVEVVDLFDNDIARVTDQTFAAFALYQALFVRRLVPLEAAIATLYPSRRGAVIEALSGVVRAFRREEVATELSRAVNAVWDRGKAEWTAELMDSFALTFASYRPAEALGRSIATLGNEPAEPKPTTAVKAEISHQGSVTDPNTLLLGRYRDDEGLRRAAIGAVVAEARQRPSRVSVLLRLLWERYGFSTLSEWAVLRSENDLFGAVWDVLPDDELVVGPMFVALAGRALQTEHDDFRDGRGRSVVISRFTLPTTVAIRSLRDQLFRQLVELMRRTPLRAAVLSALAEYANGGLKVSGREAISADLRTLEPQLFGVLSAESYADLWVVRLLRQLRWRVGLGLPPAYAPFVSSPRGRLADLLLRDPTQSISLGWQAAAAKRAAHLKNYAGALSPDRLVWLGAEVEALLATHADHDAYQIRDGATQLFVELATIQPDAMLTLVKDWIGRANPLGLSQTALLRPLNEAAGREAVWQVVSGGNQDRNGAWLLAWLYLLPNGAMTADQARLVARLILETAELESWQLTSLLDRVSEVDPAEGERLYRGLVLRIQTDQWLGRALSADFYDGAVLGTLRGRILLANPGVFEEVYYAVGEANDHFDSRATLLDALISLQPSSASRWVKWMSDRMRRPSFDDHRDYTVLWSRPDWASVLRSLARAILGSTAGELVGESILIPLLRIPAGHADQGMIIERQDALLSELVHESANDPTRCRRLFYAIASLTADRRHQLVRSYLSLDPPSNDFAALTLEPSTWGWSGSEVPLLEERRSFNAGLLPLFDRPSLLAHRAIIEERLRALDGEIRRARRTDFLDQRE